MSKFDEYLNKAKDLAEDAGEVAKNVAGEVVSKAKELTDDGRKVKELKQAAKEQSAAFALGAKERVQGALQDVRAGKEIKQGLSELQNLPETDGSILYKMELEAVINDMNSLLLIISDNRLDDASVIEEIRKVMSKVLPSEVQQPEDTEQQAIEKVKAIAYSACEKALSTFSA